MCVKTRCGHFGLIYQKLMSEFGAMHVVKVVFHDFYEIGLALKGPLDQSQDRQKFALSSRASATTMMEPRHAERKATPVCGGSWTHASNPIAEAGRCAVVEFVVWSKPLRAATKFSQLVMLPHDSTQPCVT